MSDLRVLCLHGYHGSAAILRITTSGAVTTPATVPSGDMANSITEGPDGNLWFIEPHKNNVGRLQ